MIDKKFDYKKINVDKSRITGFGESNGDIVVRCIENCKCYRCKGLCYQVTPSRETMMKVGAISVGLCAVTSVVVKELILPISAVVWMVKH